MAPQPGRRAAPPPPSNIRSRPLPPRLHRPPAISSVLPSLVNHSLLRPVPPVVQSRVRPPAAYGNRKDPVTAGLYSVKEFYTLTGVRKTEFEYFFRTYCGRATLINTHWKLFILLRWYKWYPRAREVGRAFELHQGDGKRLLYDIQRWSAWLANRIDNAEMLRAWHERFGVHNELPIGLDLVFGGQVTGHLDTFPIVLCKPRDSDWQRYTYNGKYGQNVMKVQMVVDNTGTPMWMSGPHLGTWADIRLARQHMPCVEASERLLADKAYCANDMPHLSVPFKKARRQKPKPRKPGEPDPLPPLPPPPLTDEQHAFNIVHRWYRSTVEHAYSYVKRWRIIGERYRGKLSNDQSAGLEHLTNALSVIANLCAYHNRLEPHRSHPPIQHMVPASLRDTSVGESPAAHAAALVVNLAAAVSASEEEKAQPARKRQRRRPPVAEEADVDPQRRRPDYGQYEYKWQEDIGTGYSAEQFKRQKPVWVWDGQLETWLGAVVTYIPQSGGVNVRALASGERWAVPAQMVRPRLI